MILLVKTVDSTLFARGERQNSPPVGFALCLLHLQKKFVTSVSFASQDYLSFFFQLFQAERAHIKKLHETRKSLYIAFDEELTVEFFT